MLKTIRFLTLGAVFFALEAGSAGAATSGQVTESVQLSVPPASVWSVVKGFDGLSNWHPYIASSTVPGGSANRVGQRRNVTTRDGGQLVEELLSFDESTMTYSYRINQGPMPVTDFVATMQVVSKGGGTEIVWTATFKPTAGTSVQDVSNMVRGFFTTGFDGIRQRVQ